MWHKGTGTLIYDPHRPGLKRKTDWWAVLHVDDPYGEINRYYRWWVKKKWGIDLVQPSWGTHVSVIRGEKPTEDLMHLWRYNHKTEYEFLYSHDVKHNNGPFWYVDIQCDELIEVRKMFRRPYNFGLHMTIGKIPLSGE